MILIIAGPSGSGKTTIGTLLAERLHWPFADADSFHPPANIEKMRRGEPLTDADRWPWLHAISAWADERNAAGESAVVTCSALRRAYRTALLEGHPDTRLVYLLTDRGTLRQRLAGRHGHFFPPVCWTVSSLTRRCRAASRTCSSSPRSRSRRIP